MSKNIVVCCDGTGNEIEINLSNVLKLYRCLKKDDEQVVYYDTGIGTVSQSDDWGQGWNKIKAVFGLMTGRGISELLKLCWPDRGCLSRIDETWEYPGGIYPEF